MQVDNLFLESIIGKGSFGEVYLTRIKGDNKLYATKVYNRDLIENSFELQSISFAAHKAIRLGEN